MAKALKKQAAPTHRAPKSKAPGNGSGASTQAGPTQQPAPAAKADRAEPEEFKRLFSALIDVERFTAWLATELRDAAPYWKIGEESRVGTPTRMLRAKQPGDPVPLQFSGGSGEDVTYVPVTAGDMRQIAQDDIRYVYAEWKAAIARAQDAARAAEDAAGGSPLDARWFLSLRTDLAFHYGYLHPVSVGEDGMGIVRGRMTKVPRGMNQTLARITRKRFVLTQIRWGGAGRQSKGATEMVARPDIDLVDIQLLRVMAQRSSQGYHANELALRGDVAEHRGGVVRRLRRLDALGLVVYPERKRRPATITEKGLARLRAIDASPQRNSA